MRKRACSSGFQGPITNVRSPSEMPTQRIFAVSGSMPSVSMSIATSFLNLKR